MKKTMGLATATSATSRYQAACTEVMPLNPISNTTIRARHSIDLRRLSNIFHRPMVFTWFFTSSPRSL